LSLSLIENLLVNFSQHTSDVDPAPPAQPIFVTHQLDFERPAPQAAVWNFLAANANHGFETLLAQNAATGINFLVLREAVTEPNPIGGLQWAAA